ncbi:PDZ domain-containing protein [bacterium]|nr:PDZ domain-containing protein [bacterium]
MATVNYNVSFPNVNSHYTRVQMEFQVPDGASFVDFKMPVWTPGSYKVREFSQNIDRIEAHGKGALEVERLDKNTWRILSGKEKEISIVYDVYCFTVSVRQSYVDQYYAFLHGVSVFGYVEGLEDQEIILDIEPIPAYRDVQVALEQLKAEGHVFRASNYDLLADSPIALGEFEIINYTSCDVEHRVVMMGEGNYDAEKIKSDFKKISDQECKIFGSNPASPVYIHFIQNVASGGGGLEHLNSQTSQMERWNYTDPAKYKQFLGLVAHEYFHLWNVKRIRPIELGPFEYNAENYTEMLWIAEGITSYYDDLVLFRAGMHDTTQYLKVIASQINRYENTPGKDVMNLAESSRLAWIKAYMPNENSSNTSISYYNKGMLVAWLLDLCIIKESKGKASLDDVMKQLYNEFLEDGKGMTFDHFKSVCEKHAKTSLDNFFETLVFSTQEIKYEEFLDEYGVHIKDGNADETKAWSGVHSKTDGGKVIITKIESGSPAEKAGLSVNDEIISVNDWRLSEELEKQESQYSTEQEVEVKYVRDGKLYSTKLVLERNPEFEYSLSLKNSTDYQEYWLGRAD